VIIIENPISTEDKIPEEIIVHKKPDDLMMIENLSLSDKKTVKPNVGADSVLEENPNHSLDVIYFIIFYALN